MPIGVVHHDMPQKHTLRRLRAHMCWLANIPTGFVVRASSPVIAEVGIASERIAAAS